LAFFTGWFPSMANSLHLLSQLAHRRDMHSWPPARVGARRQRARGKSLRSDCGQPECKTAAMVAEAVGYDAAKQIKGRKRHLTVDTLGLVLRVFVSAANVGERKGAKRVLKRVKRMGKAVSRVHTVWVDGGYDGTPFLIWVMDVCRWIVQVVLRPEQTKGFVLLKSVGSSSARSAGWWGRADWLETMNYCHKPRRRSFTLPWSAWWWSGWHKSWPFTFKRRW